MWFINRKQITNIEFMLQHGSLKLKSMRLKKKIGFDDRYRYSTQPTYSKGCGIARSQTCEYRLNAYGFACGVSPLAGSYSAAKYSTNPRKSASS